ncbi:MAG: acyl-protein synthetase [Clostridiales bacterium]|nr:acyl-protein synthetase [Clostridiales bacterium]
MDIRRKLFLKRDPYSRGKDEGLFVRAVREQVKRNAAGSPEYAAILASRSFSPDELVSEEDLGRLPPLPTLFFKRNRIFSVPEKKLVVKAFSSGTKGARSEVGLDLSSLLYGIMMMFRLFSLHGVISPIPTNYIVVGYEPSKHSDMGAIKTAYGTTKFAPALHREYALRDTGTGYELNPDGVFRALMRYSRQPFPVRFVGFPAYMYFLAKSLKEKGISLKLPKRSMVLLGGGWKQFSGEEIDRGSFHKLIEETLGIKKERCLEFFSAVEHPHAYVRCPSGHFHIPSYTRVIIRDADTLEPVPEGTPGLLNFITPLVSSMPLASVLTDDIAVYGTSPCPCGNKAPYFDLLGRAGVGGIKTCAASAAEMAVKK